MFSIIIFVLFKLNYKKNAWANKFLLVDRTPGLKSYCYKVGIQTSVVQFFEKYFERDFNCVRISRLFLLFFLYLLLLSLLQLVLSFVTHTQTLTYIHPHTHSYIKQQQLEIIVCVRHSVDDLVK